MRKIEFIIEKILYYKIHPPAQVTVSDSYYILYRISQLTKLQNLNLSGNHTLRSVPQCIYELSELDLFYCGLTDTSTRYVCILNMTDISARHVFVFCI